MDLSVGTIEFLLLVAAIVAMLARRFRLPYRVGLVVAGIPLSLLPALPDMKTTVARKRWAMAVLRGKTDTHGALSHLGVQSVLLGGPSIHSVKLIASQNVTCDECLLVLVADPAAGPVVATR